MTANTIATPLPPKRVIRGGSPLDKMLVAGSALSSLAISWLLFSRLTDGVGWFGFLLVWFAIFLGLVYVTTRQEIDAASAGDKVATIVIAAGTFVLLVPFTWLIFYVVSKGLPALRPGFFTHDQAGIRATSKATDGGGSNALVGSLQQVGLALVFSVPLSLLTATFLNETRSRWRRPVRILIDAMSGLPSIIAGLFIYAMLIIPLAKKSVVFKPNGFLAALALSIIMVPTITRTVEVVLRLVPDGLREAALALGASRARTVWSVVLPTARTGVTTSLVLGIARAVGETAPLLFTAMGADALNANPFSGQQESLPLFVFKNFQKPSEASIARGWTGALVLIIVVIALFVTARVLGRDRTRQTTRVGVLGAPLRLLRAKTRRP